MELGHKCICCHPNNTLSLIVNPHNQARPRSNPGMRGGGGGDGETYILDIVGYVTAPCSKTRGNE